jgi:hypothetical protein
MTIRKEVIGDATLYCGSMEDVLPTLGRFDACVADPPYGIGEAAGKNKSRGLLAVARDYGNYSWDDEPASPVAINLMRTCSRWQIIFGGNYYELPPTPCWLVWDKLNNGDFADCELAWTNMPKAVRRLQWMWNGMLRKGNEPRGFHPTQKPVGVMEWCLSHLPADVVTVVDPFAGSGTTGVACVKRGLTFTGIEREPRYFDIACKRIAEAYRQPRLAIDVPQKPVQTDMLGGAA